MKRDTPVIVLWSDACSCEGWSSEGRSESFAEDDNTDYHTIGWFVKDTDTHVTVAQSVRDDGSYLMKYGELMKIPKSSIKAIHRVKKGYKARL